MAYEYKEYPKWKYHQKLAARIVKSAAEEQELGSEWRDSPAEPAKAETKEKAKK